MKKISRNREKELIDAVAVSLCADYRRRQSWIMIKAANRRVLMEYAYINAKILDAAASIVGPGFAEIFIDEIGGGIGYARSALADNMSEVTYKIRKGEIKTAIMQSIYYL